MTTPITMRTQRSEALIWWIDKTIDGIELQDTGRVRTAFACLDLAMEHHKSIVLLIAHSLFGSGFALLCLSFEAYVRGVWLHRCATSAELKRFETGQIDCFAELLRRVETLQEFQGGVLSAAKQKSWRAMNDYTHSGHIHATRRNKETTVEPNYPDDEIF